MEAHALCLSRDGIVMAWNKSLCTLSTYNLNGILIATKQLPLSSSISCIEVSIDGNSAIVGLNPSLENEASDFSLDLTSKGYTDGESNEENTWDLPLPSICFFDLYTLKVKQNLELGEFKMKGLVL